MITRLLIANRGEIACRIARTARARGIAPLAVHSDADAAALHVREADAAFRLGPAPSAESYLRIDRLMAAASALDADAVHPGYGFLSENADFAEAVIAAGLVWVGPPPDAIRAMGAKDRAKALMAEAGVPVVPGYHGAGQEPDRLAGEAARIGYPVLIKARAGGGGKGMRRVERAGDFAEALAGARAEAAASFGDAHVLVEKWIERPRHIEMQVMADAHGRAVHLYERDCSAQRRHQKVIEEAPAPGMTPAFREAMGRAATAAALACGYVGAGTVEFIVDAAALAARADDDDAPVSGFYFMEMNTRLQVEHPVTEAVTGRDLVAMQLDLADGGHVPAQADIALEGHAIEARLYAEDPARDFLPQTGRLRRLALGGGTPAPGIRIDSGVVAGDVLTPDYDPMIAKLVAHAPDRPRALARLADALAASDVAGPETNLGFLARLVADDDFAAGRLDTGLIARGGRALAAEPVATAAEVALAGALIAGLAGDAALPGDALTGWRAWGPGRTRLVLEDASGPRQAVLWRAGPALAAEIDGEAVSLVIAPRPDGALSVTEGERSARIAVHGLTPGGAPQAGPLVLARPGRRVTLAIADAAGAAVESATGDTVTAPLPGRVTRLMADAGAAVAAGQTLAVMEAMKMEHALGAPRDGVVAEVLAAAGEQVTEGQVILRLAASDDDAAAEAATDAAPAAGGAP